MHFLQYYLSLFIHFYPQLLIIHKNGHLYDVFMLAYNVFSPHYPLICFSPFPVDFFLLPSYFPSCFPFFLICLPHFGCWPSVFYQFLTGSWVRNHLQSWVSLPTCLRYFSVAMINTLTNQLTERGVHFGPQFKIKSIMVSKSRQPELKAFGHIATEVREQKTMKASAQRSPF